MSGSCLISWKHNGNLRLRSSSLYGCARRHCLCGSFRIHSFQFLRILGNQKIRSNSAGLSCPACLFSAALFLGPAGCFCAARCLRGFPRFFRSAGFLGLSLGFSPAGCFCFPHSLCTAFFLRLTGCFCLPLRLGSLHFLRSADLFSLFRFFLRFPLRFCLLRCGFRATGLFCLSLSLCLPCCGFRATGLFCFLLSFCLPCCGFHATGLFRFLLSFCLPCCGFLSARGFGTVFGARCLPLRAINLGTQSAERFLFFLGAFFCFRHCGFL